MININAAGLNDLQKQVFSRLDELRSMLKECGLDPDLLEARIEEYRSTKQLEVTIPHPINDKYAIGMTVDSEEVITFFDTFHWHHYDLEDRSSSPKIDIDDAFDRVNQLLTSKIRIITYYRASVPYREDIRLIDKEGNISGPDVNINGCLMWFLFFIPYRKQIVEVDFGCSS